MVLMLRVSSCLLVSKVCSLATILHSFRRRTGGRNRDGADQLKETPLQNSMEAFIPIYAVYQVLRRRAVCARSGLSTSSLIGQIQRSIPFGIDDAGWARFQYLAICWDGRFFCKQGLALQFRQISLLAEVALGGALHELEEVPQGFAFGRIQFGILDANAEARTALGHNPGENDAFDPDFPVGQPKADFYIGS